jgi:hypothetical protein
LAFTVQELENIASAAIDFHFKRGKVVSSTKFNKPTLEKMESVSKEFPGGKGNITIRVKGNYSTTIQGFQHDDQVNYVNPANIRTATYPWKLIHAGISFSMQELLDDGISVVDSVDGKNTTEHSEREMTALANLLQDKLEDMQEGIDRGFNQMWWRDGTQDATLVPGIQSIVTTTPTASATVGGLDQTQADSRGYKWWANRASLNISSSSVPSNLTLINTLQFEVRQLRKYGGKPNFFPCGSNFMDLFEKELRSKGNFTLTGWAKNGTIDASVADLSFKGIDLIYDPVLDDLGFQQFGYLLDTRHIYPMVIQGENMKTHAPARPENKYVFYRAKTYAGGFVSDQRNCHGVYSAV